MFSKFRKSLPDTAPVKRLTTKSDTSANQYHPLCAVLAKLTQQQQQVLLKILVNPKATPTPEMELLHEDITQKLGINLHDFAQLSINHGNFYSTINQPVRAQLAESIVRTLRQVPKSTQLSQHDVLDAVLPCFKSELRNNNRSLSSLKTQLLNFTNELSKANPEIKPTKNLEEKINNHISELNTSKTKLVLAVGKVYKWKDDPRPQAKNIGICQVHTLLHILYKLAKRYPKSDIDVNQLLAEKYMSVATKDTINAKHQAIQKDYSSKVTQLREAIKDYNYSLTVKKPFPIASFSDNIKDIIKTRLKPPQDHIFIDLNSPGGKGDAGHSIFLSIAIKKIGGQKYYSLEYFDSNHGKDYSYAQEITIPAHELATATIQIPNKVDYSELTCAEIYEYTPPGMPTSPTKIIESELTFEEIVKRPIILKECNKLVQTTLTNPNFTLKMLYDQSDSGNSAAHFIAWNNNYPANQLLLLKHCDHATLQLANHSQETVAHYLAINGNQELGLALIAKADKTTLTSQDSKGKSVVHCLLQQGDPKLHVAIIKKLDLITLATHKNKNGCSLLEMFSEIEDSQIMRELLKKFEHQLEQETQIRFKPASNGNSYPPVELTVAQILVTPFSDAASKLIGTQIVYNCREVDKNIHPSQSVQGRLINLIKKYHHLLDLTSEGGFRFIHGLMDNCNDSNKIKLYNLVPQAFALKQHHQHIESLAHIMALGAKTYDESKLHLITKLTPKQLVRPNTFKLSIALAIAIQSNSEKVLSTLINKLSNEQIIDASHTDSILNVLTQKKIANLNHILAQRNLLLALE